MENDLISIIIPVYNQAKELELALDSIKKQTYSAKDGSASGGKNIEIIIEEDSLHEGAPVMRNRGLSKARGEYVIFWDADIVAVPEMLEKMKKCLDDNLEVSFAYCNYSFQLSAFSGQKKMNARKFDVEELKKNNYIHSTSLIRKKDAIKWDESLKRFQDWDLWLTMAEQNKSGIWLDEYLFTIIVKGTISSWLPKFAYQKPWKYLSGFRKKVKDYEQAREVILKKHSL